MARPCGHATNTLPGGPFLDGDCRVCWLAANDNAYRALWSREEAMPETQERSDCRHLGRVLSRPNCNCPLKAIHACDRHGQCTKGDGYNSLPMCTTCPDYETDDMLKPETLTAAASVDDVAELLELGHVGPWPDGWTGWRNVIDAHRLILEQAARREYRAPEGLQGRGIVSCVSAKPGWSSGKELANGYLPGAWVMAKELRRLGCTLPITFCHLGPLEWDPALTRLVEPLGVSVIDLREWERATPWRILAGWESKCAALLACPYAEALFLDADNVPVRDPSFLFDDQRYQQAGAIFWPDLPPENRKEWVPADVWHNCGMSSQNVQAFESGQLLVNKAKCWAELQVCKHINEHSDRYYQIIFGDKDTFLLAWHKVAQVRERPVQYVLPRNGAGWNGGAILQHDLDGGVLFEHGAQNKPDLHNYPHGHGCLSHPSECHGHLDELRRLWSGRLWHNEEPMGADAGTVARLLGRTYLYRRVGLGERAIRFLEDNRIGRGADRCEFSWSIVDGVLAVGDLDGKPTFLAREDSNGSWHGEWLEHERCRVELVPGEVTNGKA